MGDEEDEEERKKIKYVKLFCKYIIIIMIG
jgi:hypothetical protein